MSEVEVGAFTYPVLSPYLAIAANAAEDSVEFYTKAFGFELHGGPVRDGDGNIMHCEMKYNGALIMFASDAVQHDPNMPALLSPRRSGEVSPMTLYVHCDDVNAFYENAMKWGAISIKAPENAPWGHRYCVLQDLSGYNWYFASPLQG